MHEQRMVTGAQSTDVATPVSDISQQIAQRDAAINAIRHRLAVASAPRTRFSFRALYDQFSIEAELAAAREDRGALLRDRQLAQARD